MSALDKKVVSELQELIGDDYLTVFEAFLRTADQSMKDLTNAIESEDVKTVEMITHTLKGSSANIGAKQLSRLSELALTDARKSITDNFASHLSNIQAEYGDVSKAIHDLLK